MAPTKQPKRPAARTRTLPCRTSWEFTRIPKPQRHLLADMSATQLQKLCARSFKSWAQWPLADRNRTMIALRHDSRALLGSMRGKKAAKELHLFATLEATACDTPLHNLPPGSIATFVTGVTCEECKRTPAYAAAMRAWNEGAPLPPGRRRGASAAPEAAPALERRVAELLELIEQLSAKASLAAIAARADGRAPSRELVLVLEALAHSLSKGGMVTAALELFLQLVSPSPAFAQEATHG